MRNARRQFGFNLLEALENRQLLSLARAGQIQVAARVPAARSLPVSIVSQPSVDSGYASISGRVTARSQVRLDLGSDGSVDQYVKADRQGNFNFGFFVGFGTTRVSVSSGSGRSARIGQVSVNRVDDAAPTVAISNPAAGQVFDQPPTFSGYVGDRGLGVYQLACRVDGEEMQTVNFESDGRFTFTPRLNADGSDDGSRVARFGAIDWMGNLSSIVEVPFELRTRTLGQEFVIDTPVMALGSSDSLRFQVDLPGSTSSNGVELYDLQSDGSLGSFLGNLVDTGDPLSGDAVADDDRFTVILPIQANAVGSRQFAVKFTGPNVSSTPLVSSVRIVQPPSLSRLSSLNDYAKSTGNFARSLVDTGQSVDAALNAAKARLSADSANVMPGSVVIHYDSISWRSSEGIQFTSNIGLRNGSNVRDHFEPGATGGSDLNSDSVSTVSTSDCTGKVKILAPYFWQFEFGGTDESDDIVEMFRNKGYQVDYLANASPGSQSLTLEDFKNLGQYQAVVITTHGDAGAAFLPRIFTDVTWDGSLSQLNRYATDIMSGRVGFSENSDGTSDFFVTSDFISHYNPTFDDTIVYVGACRSGMDPRMAQAFLGGGAQAYIGYTDYVDSEFAFSHGLTTFATLLAADSFNTVGSIPGINADQENDSDPARFVAFGDMNAKLQSKCGIDDLYIEYRWAQSQKDLDTSTSFLGTSVGYACGSSNAYVDYSSDNTSYGGKEFVQINLKKALDENKWSGSVVVSLAAGWYIPAQGSGPATLTIGLKNRATGKINSTTVKTISPGSQSGCAQTPVGTVTVTVHNPNAANAYVSYALS